MHKLICLISLLCLSLHTQAQVNTDSLWSVWNDTGLAYAYTSRLKAMDQIINEVYANNPDSAIYFRKIQYGLAESYSNKEWMARVLSEMGLLYTFLIGNYDQGLECFKSSLEIRESQERVDPKQIAGTLINMGTIYKNWNDFEQALEYFSCGVEICKEMGYKDFQAAGTINMGVIYQQQQNDAQALVYLKEGAEICEEIGHKQYLSNALGIMGRIYNAQGKNPEALACLFRSLKIAEESGAKRHYLAGLEHIGNIYMGQNEWDKALDYYTRYVEVGEEMGDKITTARGQICIGQIYRLQYQYDLATEYYDRGIKICEEMDERGSILIFGLSNLASNYIAQGKYSEARDYAFRALKTSKEAGLEFNIPDCLSVLGETYKLQRDYPKAIHYTGEALKIYQKRGYAEGIKSAASKLYSTYKSTGQSGKALEMYELHIQMRDSIENTSKTKTLLQQEFQYNYEKKSLADSLTQVEKSLEAELIFQAQLHQKDQSRNTILALGLIALILALGFFARSRFVQRTNAQLKAAKERAEQSEAVKEQFLANMSHEIRTPMHAISGMVKILERNKHLSEQEIFLDAMHQSSDNLIVLLNDILDLSKIEAGKLDVESIPMKPAEVIENVHQILKFKAEEKGLALHTDISPELPPIIMGDPTRLNQILINLAGNAIKFTEKGSVSISVSKKNEFVLYEVRDTGIGIPEDKLHSIFDAFEQAEGSTARRFGGTGLGLSISRQLVELMGGNIWAESEPGKGSSFFVSLPLIEAEGKAADSQNLSEAQLMEMGAALSGKRILLAEDNEFNQMIASDDLEYYAKGIQVDIVENGALALEKAKTGLYDLILMDVQMPEMDGVEASLKIREWEQANGKARIPIIAMTASLLKSEVNLCLEAGMDNYVPKPYEAEELVGRIYEEVGPHNDVAPQT